MSHGYVSSELTEHVTTIAGLVNESLPRIEMIGRIALTETMCTEVEIVVRVRMMPFLPEKKERT